MPSSPQTVTTRNVFDYLKTPANKAIVNATVNCTLNFNAASVTSPIVNLGEVQQSTTTDQNGFWQFAVTPNDTITPTGTLYTISTPNSTYDISVPSGGADVQSSSILANTPSVLSPALTNLTGPITVTGNETVTGNLSVSGTTTLAGTTTGALTTAAQTVGGDLTISSAFRLLFGAAAAKIVPGATSISHRNNADSADNLLIADAGAVTVRNGFTLTAGDAVVTAGRLLISAAAAKILGGATSLSLRNTADTADNLLLTDAGLATLRNALLIPPAAAGTLAPTSYGTVPVKIFETTLGSATANITFSSIPAGFRSLQLVYTVTLGVTAGNLNLTFNGDTGANYDYNLMESNVAGAVAGVIGSAVVAIRVGFAGGAGFPDIAQIWIPNYASISFNKAVTGTGTRVDSNANIFTDTISGHWRNTAAITSLTLTQSAGTMGVNSTAALYGIP